MNAWNVLNQPIVLPVYLDTFIKISNALNVWNIAILVYNPINAFNVNRIMSGLAVYNNVFIVFAILIIILTCQKLNV